MRNKKIQESLAELARTAEQDHEVQMARADLYKIAKYAIKLHEMLKAIPESQGLEGWQQAKITKASDYVSSVYHNLDYEMNGEPKMGMGEISKPVAYKATLESKLKKKLTASITETEKKKGKDGKACWKGYRYAGTENGKDVCVPVKKRKK